MDKIARICWNTHDWKRPSGSEGKSQSEESYEKIIGLFWVKDFREFCLWIEIKFLSLQ